MLTRSRRRRRRRQQLAKIIDTDPYYWTQDNGAGAPIHFATTYKQLDMVHHILNNGGLVNQRDKKGFTGVRDDPEARMTYRAVWPVGFP